MSWKDAVANDPNLQRFTATGRPIPHPDRSSKGRALNTLLGAENRGNAAPNLLPVRFTDDSIISVPVLPPQKSPLDSQNLGMNDDDVPIKEVRSKSRLGLFLRRASASASSGEGKAQSENGNGKGKGKGKEVFVLKKMTRSEYLRRYAKDEEGRYIGTEEPADDCILNSEEDRGKYRRPFE